jgi:putative hemolysin
MSHHTPFLVAALAIVLALAVFIFRDQLFTQKDTDDNLNPTPTAAVNDFNSCIIAGYPTTRTYPEQCTSPDGRIFVNDEPLPASGAPTAPVTGLANPASVFCEQNNGTVDIITAPDGSQSGACRFADGFACDEWEFYRGDCHPPSQQTDE